MHIQSTIEASEHKFSPAIARVAEAVRLDPSIVLNKSISELAGACGTSVATVVRFCQMIGLTGYAQLRMFLAAELGKEEAKFGAGVALGAEVAKSDTLEEMAAKVASLGMLAIDETVTGLDFDALRRVVDAIDNAQRILLFGIGASQFVAQDLHHKLFRVGRTAFILADPHEAWSAALLSPQGTVALAFSHSGATAETIRFVEIAKQAGALTVAFTGSRDAPLAKAADEKLISRARESNIRAGAMVSRIAQLAVVDCLFLGVARQRYEDTLDALKRTRNLVQDKRGNWGL